MNRTERKGKIFLILGILLMLQVIAAFCFSMKKTGFHYDEYYSYYSSNVTYGLVPTDREWKPGEELRSEFAVLPGEGFDFSTVVRMQTYDVHPPFYYILLHAVCSLTPGVFTKWSGLALNLLFFVGSWLLLAGLARRLTGVGQGTDRRFQAAGVLFVCLLYGFNPAVFSGIMLVRMYMLLGLLLLLLTWLHVRALETRKRGWRFYLPVMLTVYLGFLTHYYFAVYLFFLAAAMEFYLLFETAEKKTWGQKWKDCFGYGFAVAGAMLLAVVSYRACLGHIFRGYRGTEAMGAFFDSANTLGRIRFFIGLLNEYAFGNMLPLFLLVLVLLALTVGMLGRRRQAEKAEKVEKTGKPAGFWEHYRMIWIPAAATLGYFAVVTKTALLTAEEANRYQIPVYGMILLLAGTLLVLLVQRLCSLVAELTAKQSTSSAADGRKPVYQAGLLGLAAVTAVLTAGQLYGLSQDRVLFLYEEDAENISFAAEHGAEPVVYFYNPDLMWMIWDDSQELMQYEQIYFVNMTDVSAITDENIRNADSCLVYIARHENAEAALAALVAGMGPGADAVRIRELLYCDLYEVTR